MLEPAVMIEGQNGLTWANWMRWARAVQDLGFVGLYRSDHYTNADSPYPVQNGESVLCHGVKIIKTQNRFISPRSYRDEVRPTPGLPDCFCLVPPPLN